MRNERSNRPGEWALRDEDIARGILDERRRRAGSGGAAVLLVTHDADLARAADRVLLLKDGRLLLG